MYAVQPQQMGGMQMGQPQQWAPQGPPQQWQQPLPQQWSPPSPQHYSPPPPQYSPQHYAPAPVQQHMPNGSPLLALQSGMSAPAPGFSSHLQQKQYDQQVRTFAHTEATQA